MTSPALRDPLTACAGSKAPANSACARCPECGLDLPARLVAEVGARPRWTVPVHPAPAGSLGPTIP